MIADSSALVAIVFGEPDARTYLDALRHSHDVVRVSAVSAAESGIVTEARSGPDASRDLSLLLEGVGAIVEPVTLDLVPAVVAAWKRFGKGRHPARLNLGDCFSYALAQSLGEPLLFKGNDFAQTDVTSVLG